MKIHKIIWVISFFCLINDWAYPQEKTVSRSFELVETMEVTPPQNSKSLRIWVPIPAQDSYQDVRILEIESPFPYRFTHDPNFKNRLLYMESVPVNDKKPLKILMRYQITRYEQSPSKNSFNSEPPPLPLKNYLKSRGLEIINKKIRTQAQKSTAHLKNPMEKAQALYQYVLNFMSYDKTGTGWGEGDSVYACEVGKGNCTDFHALFISLARSCKIPSRFRMGFSLPKDEEGKPSGSYHCWAEFYVAEMGWIPVDISEAWKDRSKTDYFFGNLDPDRVLLTTGREIVLEPKQSGKPLNYLSKPYVEIDGNPTDDFLLERHYKNGNEKVTQKIDEEDSLK